jgi:predicted adenylyl cyclase CyaB
MAQPQSESGHSGRNVELKLHLVDRHEAARVLAELGATYDDTITQIDTYYEADGRRVKQREETGAPPVLIVYNRPDAKAPSTSHYTIHPLDEAPTDVRALMRNVVAVVRKQREVWLHENVRIHLDSVEGLGEFLEFEAIIDDNRDEVASRVMVDQLLDAFRDAVGDVLGVSNLDLMLARTASHV